MMRTTVNLPDDVTDLIRSVSDAKGISLGEAIAELIRRGFEVREKAGSRESFPCFAVPPDAPPITLEQTLSAEDEI